MRSFFLLALIISKTITNQQDRNVFTASETPRIFVRFRLTAHQTVGGSCAIWTERNLAWEPRPHGGNTRDRTKRGFLNSLVERRDTCGWYCEIQTDSAVDRRGGHYHMVRQWPVSIEWNKWTFIHYYKINIRVNKNLIFNEYFNFPAVFRLIAINILVFI